MKGHDNSAKGLFLQRLALRAVPRRGRLYGPRAPLVTGGAAIPLALDRRLGTVALSGPRDVFHVEASRQYSTITTREATPARIPPSTLPATQRQTERVNRTTPPANRSKVCGPIKTVHQLFQPTAPVQGDWMRQAQSGANSARGS